MRRAATVLSTPPDTAPICRTAVNSLLHHRKWPRRSAYHLGLIADKLANPNNLLLGEVAHLPVGTGLADFDCEVEENICTLVRVRDLGVQLDTCSTFKLG
jgi:hypothetical protein